LLDQRGYLVEGDCFEVVPVIDKGKNLADARTEVWVGREHVPHEVSHLFRVVARFVPDGSVDDAKLSLVLEGVISIVEHEEHAPEHPDIDPVIDRVF
jgi:hypothetical protein